MAGGCERNDERVGDAHERTAKRIQNRGGGVRVAFAFVDRTCRLAKIMARLGAAAGEAEAGNGEGAGDVVIVAENGGGLAVIFVVYSSDAPCGRLHERR